jgi:heme A synthase
VRSRFASYAWLVLAFNLLVILWGAVVRATGSGAGCGSHWPLCDGAVLPHDPAVATLIELSHRLTSGLALLLVIGLAAGAWRRHPPGHRVRRGAACSVLFIFTEALIGAGLVLLEYVADDTRSARALWVSGHLLNTFLLLAALALTAWWASGAPPLRLRRRERLAVPFALALAVFLVLGMSGAVTALGDTLFPVSSLAEGKALTFSPTAHLFVRLRVWHPALAVAVGVCLAAVLLQVWRLRPIRLVRRFATVAAALYVIQLAVGVVNVWLLAPVAVQVLHLLLSDLIWITLVLLAAIVLTENANADSHGTGPGSY